MSPTEAGKPTGIRSLSLLVNAPQLATLFVHPIADSRRLAPYHRGRITPRVSLTRLLLADVPGEHAEQLVGWAHLYQVQRTHCA